MISENSDSPLKHMHTVNKADKVDFDRGENVDLDKELMPYYSHRDVHDNNSSNNDKQKPKFKIKKLVNQLGQTINYGSPKEAGIPRSSNTSQLLKQLKFINSGNAQIDK